MKKFFAIAIAAVLSMPVIFSLQGCFKDSCKNTYTIYSPVYKKLSEVRASMKSESPRAFGKTGKIYVYGNYIFLNEERKGIHVIDNSNPAVPKNISFINIPGNLDLAVKGNYLYADCYSDIVVFDVSNPAGATVSRFMDNIFKEQGYFWGNHTNPDSVSIIVDYAKRDTTVDCETYNMWSGCRTCTFDAGGRPFLTNNPLSFASSAQQQGIAGSMSRFVIVNDHMYGVSNSRLYAFNINNPSQPIQTGVKNIGWGIETIYPFKDKLFIGSTTGMFIYNISNPADPVSEGRFNHANSCDPVITDGQHAYVTLRSGSFCQGFSNQLDVLDVTNTLSPQLLKTYTMTNPHGLSKDGNTLFICDGKAGLKVYDASQPGNLRLLKTIGGMQTYDIITLNGNAIVIAKDGLYQYNYSNLSNIRLVSKISVSR